MNLPYEFEQRMRGMLGEEYELFYESLEDTPVYRGIRVNPRKKDAFQYICKIIKEMENTPWCKEGFYCNKSEISGNHPYHRAGLFYFQEPSAMSAVEGLPISPDDKILDLCAAPGGKSTQAAAKLSGKGFLVSNEIIGKRAAVLSENIERMGLPNVIVTNESPLNLEKKYPHFFDKIIVDAPCSGEGMFRKEPQAVDEWSVAHTLSCAARQKNIVDSAMKMLAPGGYLIYSTCTFAPVENEGVAEYLLDTYPNLELADMKALSMLCGGCGAYIGSERDYSFTKRIFPHRQKGEGHFAALFHDTGKLATIQRKREKNKRILKEDISAMIQIYEAFERENLRVSLAGAGVFAAFGERLYLKPPGIDIDTIRVIRCGLELGTCKKGRFEPSHALCLALSGEDFKHCLNFSADAPELLRFLKGDVLPCKEKGWTAVMVDGFPVGWGKASGGVLKNHYPKRLRALI